MSTFVVDIRPIEKIWPHPNADRLELGKVAGLEYQFVIQKDLYKEGELVVYFPIDSIFPESLKERFEITYLSGPNKNRVKTLYLRKEFSQGFILPFNRFTDLLPDSKVYDDVTQLLGITKYEAEAVIEKNAFLYPLPEGVGRYDIEGIERFPSAVEDLMQQVCWITEKLEGMNYSATYDVTDDKLYVSSRNNTIVEKEDGTHSFWETTRELGLDVVIKNIQKKYFPNCKKITIRGEFIGPGIQSNIYKLKKFAIYIFDILVDRSYIDSNMLLHIAEQGDLGSIPLVPTISKDLTLIGWLNGRTIADASNGKSLLEPNTKREGIVIKPPIEMNNDELGGRLILKKRSPDYLANSDF